MSESPNRSSDRQADQVWRRRVELSIPPSNHVLVLVEDLVLAAAEGAGSVQYASVQPKPCSPRLSDFVTVPRNSR